MKRVTAAIIIRDDKVFIARRAADQKLPGLWEFPGGKVDEGESEKECLARELAEEFGVSATIGNFFMESEYHYGHGSICLLAYFVKELSGEINPTVHDEICWVETTALLKYNLAPADVPIAESLIKRGDKCLK